MTRLIKVLKISVLLLAVVACQSDDGIDIQNPIPVNYFPLTLNNYWNFDVENTNLNTNDTQTRRDSLYVSNNNASAYSFAVIPIANGTMNSILTQSELKRTGLTLTGTGAVTFPIDGLDDFQIFFEDALFYDLNASANTILSQIEGTNEQIVETLPITTNYTMRTIQGETFETQTLNNDLYTNVTVSSIVIEMNVTTEVEVIPGQITDVTIMAPQNVLEITNYYAEDIGLVRSEADIMYQLEDFSSLGITLPFPSNLEAISIQELDNFGVTEE